MPRAPPVTAVLVETPEVKIRSRSASGTPGPSSVTVSTMAPSSSRRETVTWPPGAVASTALSIRLPSTVTRSVVPSGAETESGSTSRVTPRSPLVVILARSRATTSGSVTWGATAPWLNAPPCPARSMKATASSVRPSSMRPDTMCIRLENSCACARSALVRSRAPSRSRNVACSSVRSRRTNTAPTSRPSMTAGLHCASSTRSPASSSCSLLDRARRSSSASGSRTSTAGLPTTSPSSPRSREASSLASTTRSCSSTAITPSLIPCNIASRASSKEAISSGSRR